MNFLKRVQSYGFLGLFLLSGCYGVPNQSDAVDRYLGTYQIVDKRNALNGFQSFDRINFVRTPKSLLYVEFYLPNAPKPVLTHVLGTCRSKIKNSTVPNIWCTYDGMVFKTDWISFEYFPSPYVSYSENALGFLDSDNAMPVESGYVMEFVHGGTITRLSLKKL